MKTGAIESMLELPTGGVGRLQSGAETPVGEGGRQPDTRSANCVLHTQDRPTVRGTGDDYFDRLNPVRTARRLVARLERLGLQVALNPLGTPTPEG